VATTAGRLEGTARVSILGMDAGGTMTDTIAVDERGQFTIGKALTTPQDESVGFFESVADALSYWDSTVESVFPQLDASIYAGTTMLNTLLRRSGRKLGLLTTAGFEDDMLIGRGVQAWISLAYSDRLHAVTHKHPERLLSRRNVCGITERIDVFGTEVIPLYEHEVEEATRKLLGKGVEAIVIHFLYSYLNPSHELRAEEIVRGIVGELGRNGDVEIFCGSTVRPVIRENSRLNCALLEAYAAAPSRAHLFKIEDALKANQYRYQLQTVLAYGGLCNIRYPRLHETFISGPVGGIMAGGFVSDLIGEENVIVTDMGGTSFDIAAFSEGHIPVKSDPTIAGFTLNLPTLDLESIGAGAGSYIRLDPVTNKIEIGPDGAGADPGPVCFKRGNETLTMTDCDVALGYLNPENFLGGSVHLDSEVAFAAVKEQLADPLGVNPYDAAEAAVKLLGLSARDAIRRVAGIRGLDTSRYILFAYGGAGPVHVLEYTRGLRFKGVVTFKFAAAFSAFGTTVGDYMHRYSKTVFLFLPPQPDEPTKLTVADVINRTWVELEEEAYEEMGRDGIPRDAVDLDHLAMMRYTGQLNDLETLSPVSRCETAADVDRIVSTWEALYERINSRVSKYEQAGYQIFELGVVARTAKPKPELQRHDLHAGDPDSDAQKGTRRAYFEGDWHEASIWDMDSLRAGNVVHGPAIAEHPMTTLVIPPGSRARLDEWEFLWLERD
jgi:acetone carboxylase, beta subunit